MPGGFLLTHLLRGATDLYIRPAYLEINFYSRTSCEVQHIATKFKDLVIKNFYSRTSCEVQQMAIQDWLCEYSFLLTHLLRGATYVDLFCCDNYKFLLTHLLRGATELEKNKKIKKLFQLSHLFRRATK